uniref:Uncharacterized protein n=1 Tax=Peronospora matthiolae TaxID=2874970 RepID=A0AAV1U4W7_9STRA
MVSQWAQKMQPSQDPSLGLGTEDAAVTRSISRLFLSDFANADGLPVGTEDAAVTRSTSRLFLSKESYPCFI